jgi:hypothetical protein
VNRAEVRDCFEHCIVGLPERAEFELPVPVCKLPGNSVMSSFATSRRVVKGAKPGPHLWRAVGLSLKRTVAKWIALSGRISSDLNHAARLVTLGDG